MVRKPAILVLIGVTLFGCLGGLAGALVRSPHYQVDAVVIVYEMPHDLRELIGPDEAQQIDDIYKQGALQPKVSQQVLNQFPGMTAAQLHASIQVTPIAYSPLTRITATARTPDQAVALANAVAVAWTSLADNANSNAWDSTVAALKSHESDLYTRIGATQKAIADAQSTGTPIEPLQAQLASELQQLAKTDDSLVTLDKDRLVLIGNAYVATPADAANAVRVPDPVQLAAQGAAGGFALGLVFALWLVYRQFRKQIRLDAMSGDPRPLAAAGATAGEAYDER